MLRLLINSLAKEFYQQHAGYFLIGFYLLFGIVEPSQLIGYHKALLLAGVSSPVGVAIVSACWILYSAKVYFFIRQKLALAQYNFINEIGSLNKSSQLKLWISLYSLLLLPIIIYMLVIIGIGVNNQLFLTLLCLLIVFSVLINGLAFISYRSVSFGFLSEERNKTIPYVKFKKPFYSWLLFYLFNEQPLMLFMCKVLSLLFFKSMLWMFADVGHDTPVLLVAILAAILCHGILVFTLLKFEITYLNFTKSLSISTYKRLFGWLIILAIILIPEWIFLIISSEFNFITIVNGFLFGMAGMFFLVTLLYVVKLDMDIYLRWLLFYFFISMWSIPSNYYLPFSLILFGCSTLYYLKNFNKIDLKVEE
jgi:hypothetical protein